MICPSCSVSVKTNLRYCTNCGQPLLFKIPLINSNALNNFFIDDTSNCTNGKAAGPLLFKEAIDLFHQHDFKKAEKFMLELIIRHPEESKYHNLLGCIYLKQEKYNLALIHYDEAIETNPLLWEAYYNKGIIYSNQKKYLEAKTSFKKAFKLNQKHYLSLYNVGTILLKEDRYQEAIKAFVKVKELAPEYDNNRINLNLALNKSKKSAER